MLIRNEFNPQNLPDFTSKENLNKFFEDHNDKLSSILVRLKSLVTGIFS
jgi:predicted DNA binding CopG/RHH family protein